MAATPDPPFTTLRFERRDRAAWVTLQRPPLNALTLESFAELERVFAIVEADTTIHALVVTGDGDRAFSVGADISLLDHAIFEHDWLVRFIEGINAMLLRFEALPVPTIAAVNGVARAGGFELLLAADLVVVAEEARIGDNHTGFGLMPGGGATQRAPRQVGAQRARELIYSGRWLSAAEAVSSGLALRAVPRAQLIHEVEALLATIVDKPRATLAAVKRAMARGAALPIAEAIRVEIEEFYRLLEEHDEPREGYRAYREGRTPSWALRDAAPRSDGPGHDQTVR